MQLSRLSLMALLLFAGLSNRAVFAGYQFDIVGLNPSYVAGSSGSFDFVLTITAPETSPVSNIFGYTASFDTNAGNANLGLAFTSGNYVAPGSGGINMSAGNFGAFINGFQTVVSLSNFDLATVSVPNGAILGRVNFTIDAGVADGTVFTISTRTTQNDFLDGTFATVPGFTELGQGSFTVTAVPEPTTLGLVGFGLVAVGARLRRRFASKALAA